MTSADPDRWAWAEIDLSALDHNIGVLRAAVAPAALWAVVKADGYGHGAVAISEQALRSGAAGLCVALAGEGIALRRAGIEAPILVLSQQPRQALPAMLSERLMATVYTDEHLADLAAVATDSGGTFDVHVKVDTGMHRVGVAPDAATALIRRANATSGVRLGGVFTHLACADEPESVANAEQLGRFEDLLQQLAAAGLEPPLVHAANSAGGLALMQSRFDLVRAGIGIYGISPGRGVDHLAAALRPVMSLTARIGQVKHVAAGEHVSYGWRHRFESDTVIATVPIGYADGVPRRLGTLHDCRGADVLIGGRRCPIVGVVTMDQVMVDVGPDADSAVAVGDEVVLIGRQGEHVVTADDWAQRLGTIGYEIVCGISARVPRHVRPARSGPASPDVS
jgi:alanine racemase